MRQVRQMRGSFKSQTRPPTSKLACSSLSFGGGRCGGCGRYFEKLSEDAANNVTPYHDTGSGTTCHSVRPVLSPVRGGIGVNGSKPSLVITHSYKWLPHK